MARLSRKKIKYKMDDDTFQGVVYKLAQDAAFHIDHDIADERIKATSYYRGDPFGNEEEGRSQAVQYTVRDTINQVLPSLLRVFCGSETAVEFIPTNESEVQMANDATDAINNIFYTKCHGYSQVLEPAFQDALVRKTGVLYWWFEEKKRVRDFVYKGKTEDEMDAILAGDPSIVVVQKTPSGGYEHPTTAQADPRDPELDPAVIGAVKHMISEAFPEAEHIEIEDIDEQFDFRVRRTTVDPQLRVECLPPEQFIISRAASHEGNAVCIGRRQVALVGDLVALGFDFDEILENMGSIPFYSVSPSNMEAQVRDPSLLQGRTDSAGDDSLREVIYNELFCRIDRDGDGVPELWRIQTIGEHQYILHAEIYEDDEPPFALLCPYPEPHRAIGVSMADLLIDLQEQNSQVMRNTYDAFAASIHPPTAFVEGQVNVDDLLNTETGRLIRMRQPGMVQELTKTFNGQAAMDLMAQLAQIKAERTGISAASQGLDPEVLQSTTAVAVAANTSAADQVTEMIARRFAEGGMKRMFAGMLRLLCRHFDEPLDITRRDGTMAKIDPRTINPDLLLSCNVGLGKGRDQDRLAMLQQVLQYQQLILQAAGITPMVGPNEIRNTIASMCEIAGIKDVSKYIKAVPQGWAPPQQNQQANPQMIVAQGQVQSEVQKNQIAAATAHLDHERAMQKMQLDFQMQREKLAFEREKMAQDRVLQLATIQAEYGAKLTQAEMDQQIATEKAQIDLMGGMASQQMDLAHQADQAHLDRVHALEQQGLQHAADHAESTFTPAPEPTLGDTGAPTE